MCREDINSYIPSKVSYGEDELSRDLLDFASASLKDGGRLVFLVPTSKVFVNEILRRSSSKKDRHSINIH